MRIRPTPLDQLQLSEHFHQSSHGFRPVEPSLSATRMLLGAYPRPSPHRFSPPDDRSGEVPERTSKESGWYQANVLCRGEAERDQSTESTALDQPLPLASPSGRERGVR